MLAELLVINLLSALGFRRRYAKSEKRGAGVGFEVEHQEAVTVAGWVGVSKGATVDGYWLRSD